MADRLRGIRNAPRYALESKLFCLHCEQTACSGFSAGETISSCPHFSRFITLSSTGGSSLRSAFAHTSALISSRRFREIGFGTIALCTYKITFGSFTPIVAALMRCIFTTTGDFEFRGLAFGRLSASRFSAGVLSLPPQLKCVWVSA